jgi:hypothetical protein
LRMASSSTIQNILGIWCTTSIKTLSKIRCV